MRLGVDLVEALSIPYFVGGSVASITYGKARSTRDIDVVLSLNTARLDEFLERADQAFYVDPTAAQRAVDSGDCFNLIELSSIFQVDVLTPEPSHWMESQFSRSRRHLVGGTRGVQTLLCSPEDVVLNKLVRFELGNPASSVQWQDALGVLKVQGNSLEHEYITRWADELNVADLLRTTYAEVHSLGR